jgi:hypothetical protein
MKTTFLEILSFVFFLVLYLNSLAAVFGVTQSVYGAGFASFAAV